MKNNRAFRGVWVPAEIWLHKGLTLQEKMMLVEVDSLDNENGCFAGNAHFAEFLGISERQVQRLVKSLKDKGYVSINYKYKPNSKEIESRSIRVVQENYPRFIPAPIAREAAPGGGDTMSRGVVTKMSPEVVTDLSQGGDKNVADSNTDLSNTVFNNTSKGATVKKTVATPQLEDIFSPTLADKVKDWIQYKKERREAYKEIGLKSLITEIRHNVERYGEQAVIDLITSCMAAGYKGIIFDRLKQSGPVNTATQAQTKPQETGNPFLRMLKEAEAREATK